MKVEQIYTKCLAQGSYYIESNGEAVVIDPLRDVDEYLKSINYKEVFRISSERVYAHSNSR